MGVEPRAKDGAAWAVGAAMGAGILLLLARGDLLALGAISFYALILGVVGKGLARAQRQRQGIREWAAQRNLARSTSLNLSFEEIDRYSGQRGVLRVTFLAGRRRSAIRISAPLKPGEEVDIQRRAPGESGEMPTGNPILDPLVVVRKAPAAVAARLADPANLPAAMKVMHGYKRWEIRGSGELLLDVSLDNPVSGDALEEAYQDAAALVHALAGPEPAKLLFPDREATN